MPNVIKLMRGCDLSKAVPSLQSGRHWTGCTVMKRATLGLTAPEHCSVGWVPGRLVQPTQLPPDHKLHISGHASLNTEGHSRRLQVLAGLGQDTGFSLLIMLCWCGTWLSWLSAAIKTQACSYSRSVRRKGT